MTSPADGRIYLRLGYAVSKTQLLEVAMVKLLEALRQDLSQPLDDRWDEISEWLDLPAGRIKRRLGLPEAVAEDLHATIGRRNRVAHEAWLLYSLASDREASAETWAPWLDDEAAMFGEVTRGVALLAEFVREARAEGREVDAAGLERKWREDVPQPIAPRLTSSRRTTTPGARCALGPWAAWRQAAVFRAEQPRGGHGRVARLRRCRP